jgi:hypothetical protein
MKIVAIFGKEINHQFKDDILFLLSYLKECEVEIQIHKKYLSKLKDEFEIDLAHVMPFSSTKNRNEKP